MTLEDFFTPTELKDGLTTPARVNELLAIMQKEKESDVKNEGETTRQQSAVASTVAATVNKECLDLFIQSDGLWFIDRWLNDAQKFESDTGNSHLEDLIVLLLRALERLQVDNNGSITTEFRKTVEGLLVHGSSVVQEKAKTLYDSWTLVQDVEQKNDPKMVQETDNEEMVKETDNEELSTQETITESATIDPCNTSVAGGNLAFNVESDESKPEITALTGISCSEPTVPGGTCEEQSDASPLDNKHVKDANEKQEITAGAAELTTLSSPLPTSNNAVNVSESAAKTETREESSVKDEDMMNGGESREHHHSTMEFNATSHVSDSSSESENPKTISNTESYEGGIDTKDATKHVGIRGDDESGTPRRSIKGEEGDLIGKRTSDMELDYGIVDPLELARQVANEVEREVDDQEQSCSSSPNISDGGIGDWSKENSSSVGEPVNNVEIPVPKTESGQPEILSTEISKKTPESDPNVEKGFSGFDLNEEFSSEEIDCPLETVFTPVSVVSVSRAAVADGLPVAPLQFEGTLGWKGTAATSAFRRIPEVEKTLTSKQRLDHLDFDLNVAEGNEDKIDDLFPGDKMPMTSFLPPSADGSGRVQLDLNSLCDGDSGTIALDWKRDGQIASLRSNGPLSPSASSSSSSIQPSFRNIDLNLNDLSTPNNASLDNPFLNKLFNKNTSGGAFKRDESVISIFGTQFEVKRKDSIRSSNGRILDPAVDFSLGRPGSDFGIGSSIPYANLPAGYGQNSFPMGPSMSFTSPMYGSPGGPIPYMVDSRGAPFMMGTSSSIPPAFAQPTQPFLFNMAAAGPSRQNLDLNPGFFSDGGNLENNGGLRQFFMQNQGRGVDEEYLRMHNSLQASSSLGKRQEPDGGWEPLPINYKHHPPPWQ